MATPLHGKWLDKLGEWLKGKPGKDGEVRGYCPWHEHPATSKSESASYNILSGQFYCHVCGDKAGKTIDQAYKHLISTGELQPPSRSQRSKGKTQARPLPPKKRLKQFRKNLFNNKAALDYMTKERGISVKVLEKFKVGYNAQDNTDKGGYTEPRFWLPVTDFDGNLINVRRHKQGAAPEDKMKNIPGHGQAALYGIDALRKDVIILVEGEMDVLCGRSIGLNTMTHTGGAGAWQAPFSRYFEGKKVFICYDNDSAGRQGAAKTANSLVKFAEVRIMPPLVSKEGGDLTDWIVKQGGTLALFKEAMETADEVSSARVRRKQQLDADPIQTSLWEGYNPALVNVPVYFNATASGLGTPYLAPKKVNFACSVDWGDKCQKCSLEIQGGNLDVEYAVNEVEYLTELLDKPKETRSKDLLSRHDIQRNCPKVEVTEDMHYSVEIAALVPSVDEQDQMAVTEPREAYIIGYRLPANTPMRLTGTSIVHPRNGQNTFVAWESEPTKTNLDKFQMTPELARKLRKVFNPKSGQSDMSKLNQLAEDEAANVTHIYDRPELHIGMSLVYHSVLELNFRGKPMDKGWLEMLVVGDTRTGKSEVASQLVKHYQAGVWRSCEGMTFAGLVGGVEQSGSGRHMLTWGLLPLNDGRLAVLDEVSGLADKDVIPKMSSVRSSGLAQIIKIKQGEAKARVRTIWLGNPPNNRPLNEMPRGGIDALAELIPAPEDRARFDMVMGAASADVSSAIINQPVPDPVRHRSISELSAALVMWAWSRKAEQVHWEEGVEDYIMEQAEHLGHQYIEDPPLVQAANVRTKLARISVAIAARLFSTDEAGELVLVKQHHVDTAVAWLNRIYSHTAFNYAALSRREIRAQERARQNSKRAWKYLRNYPGLGNALSVMSLSATFKLIDIENHAELDRETAKAHLVELTAFGVIRQVGRGNIQMTQMGIELIKKWQDKQEE